MKKTACILLAATGFILFSGYNVLAERGGWDGYCYGSGTYRSAGQNNAGYGCGGYQGMRDNGRYDYCPGRRCGR